MPPAGAEAATAAKARCIRGRDRDVESRDGAAADPCGGDAQLRQQVAYPALTEGERAGRLFMAQDERTRNGARTPPSDAAPKDIGSTMSRSNPAW
jgi:hypothetical protein